VDQRHTAVVERLLALGAHPDQTCRRGFTALHVAAQLGWPDVIRVLCAAGATLRWLPDHEHSLPEYCRDYDPLWDASAFIDTLEALLEAGADPKGHGALTALEYASRIGRVDIVQFFIRAMGEWTQVNRGGKVLAVAAGYGNLEIVIELLMARGSGDDAKWHRMVQRAITRARRQHQHTCLPTLEASTRH
jgi:ankyrin repeat protein